MKVFSRTIKLAVLITAMSLGFKANAADTSIALLNISGSVPAVFSVTARGLPGDLDLTPGVIVNDRLIGILHFKYNNDVATLTVGAPAPGLPANGGTAYPFGGGGGMVFSGNACNTIDDALLGAVTDLDPAVDVASAAATGVIAGGFGYEEDCSLSASWVGQAIVAGQIPLAGVYSMSITVTMVSI